MARYRKERLVLMLAMHVDQSAAEGSQHGDGCQAAIEGTALPA